MANLDRYGFRPVRTEGAKWPPPLRYIEVASGQAFNVTGGIQAAALRQGDVITRLNTGTATFCAGNETTPVAPLGVVAHIEQYFDAGIQAVTRASTLPSSVVWGTVEERRSIIAYWPIEACEWEVGVNAVVAASDTIPELRLQYGLNLDFINSGPTVGTNPLLQIRPRMDMSTANTTATLMFRFLRVSQNLGSNDPSLANFRVVVRSNVSQENTALGV